jgi:hypothetical protein
MKTNIRFNHMSLSINNKIFRRKGAEEIETHILCPITFFVFKNRAVYEVMWKNIVQPDRPQTTI